MAATEDEPLLRDLCMICHINPPRYRCPRCAHRTCSLPCTRRHKLWAQCSGVRDPARYVKRSDLATPAGIDRDFNYLVGIERQIDRVGREVENRGIPVAAPEHGPRGRPNSWQKGELNLTTAIQNARVIVERAPVGMQRQRENKTRWYKKRRCLSWTVEWIDDAGHRSVSAVFETTDLQTAYARVPLPTRPDGSRPTTRRNPLNADDHPSPGPSPVRDQSILHFYLVRPHTPSAARVLIPVPHTSSISDVLRDQVVLEFPTFYVLSSAEDALPDGFITEQEFLDSARRGGPMAYQRRRGPTAVKDDPTKGEGNANGHQLGKEPEQAHADIRHIMHVLTQDIVAGPAGDS